VSDGELAVARTVCFCVLKVTPGYEITGGCLMKSDSEASLCVDIDTVI
jgi:hypothetical protein